MALIDKTKLRQDLNQYFNEYAAAHKGELTQDLMNELGKDYLIQNRTRYLSKAFAVWWWQWYLTGQQEPQGLSFLTTKQMRKGDNDVLLVDTTIPIGNGILISIDKWISLAMPFTPCEELATIAHKRVDTLTKMGVTIDGIEHTPLRIDSGSCFEVRLKKDMHDMELGPDVKKGKYKAFTDGYWLLLEPKTLSDGQHVIKTNAACSAGILSLAVEYNIKIM